MPNKRSYGFKDSSEKKTKENSKKKEVPNPKTKKISNGGNLGNILVFPFKLIGWILKTMWWVIVGIWTGISSLWSKRPGLKKETKGKFKKYFLWGSLTIFVTGVLGAIILLAWVNQSLPDPNQLTQRQVAQSTKIYDRTGEHLLYEIYADKNRTLVELNEVPDSLKNAVIATEDTEFYDHYGVRPLSIVRAVVTSVVTGERIEGTSTLTQQLVKNAILSPRRTIMRKVKEIILAFRLEQKYSKKQILKIYFNEIPYGSTNYGVEAAAQSYFGKSAKDLNLQEAATLAGMPKAPTSYLNNPKLLKQRRNFVLRRMHEEGFISKEKEEETQEKPLTLSRDYEDIKAPHFVLHVRKKLVDRFGEKKVDTGGLKVITTLDWDKQKAAKEVVSSTGKKVLEKAGANNTSLVAMDPNNSQILAMIGSKDFNNNEINGKFNVATQGKRQPGSSFKPIVYTAAFEKGYTPSTILYDVLTDFAVPEETTYEPKNYDLEERGPVTMRKALQGSMNIPAVKTLYLVGEKYAIDFAERLGYSTLSKGDFGLSLVLGGGEVRLLDHVNAYSVLANGGIFREPTSILKVEDSNREVILEKEKKEGERVLDSKYAKLITDVLSDNQARAFAFGQDNILNLKDRPVAAKTGTTNDYVDAWTVGYTPNLVAGVWAGNTDNSEMKRGFGGSKVAGPIWNEFMTKALKDKEVKNFSEPPKINTDKAILNGVGGKMTVNVNEVTGLRASSSTPDHLIEERTYVPPHSILHYIDKDNPRGPRPEDPSQDPQYKVWEQAIKDWKKRMKEENPDWNLTFEDPPTGKDTGYSEELVPTLNVVFPKPSSTLNTRQIDTDVRATAPRGVEKVTYKIDGRYISVERQHPFNLNYYARSLKDGKHILTIVVEDDIGHRRQETIPFTLNAGDEPPNVSWIKINRTLNKSDFPLTLLLKPFKDEQISKIEITANNGRGLTKLVGTINNVLQQFNDNLQIKWSNYPGEGNWMLNTEITTKDGKVYKGESMSIKIKKEDN